MPSLSSFIISLSFCLLLTACISGETRTDIEEEPVLEEPKNEEPKDEEPKDEEEPVVTDPPDEEEPVIVIPKPIDFETTEYNKNYSLGSIKASAIYARGGTGKGVTVSVLDTPFNTAHADLQNVFVTGYDPANGLTEISCNTSACPNHGNYVVGVIAANKNNIGMHGVAYEAKIKPVTIFNNAGVVYSTIQIADAIYNGSGDGIIAMNNSWGLESEARTTIGSTHYYYRRPNGTNFTDENGGMQNDNLPSHLLTALKSAVNNDTIVVFANGNHGLNSETGKIPTYDNASFSGTPTDMAASTLLGADANLPANIPGFEANYASIDAELLGKWIAVVAVDSDNKIVYFSNGCGTAKDFCLAAPGWAVYTTSNGATEPEKAYGTSIAAPHVTASLAALKSMFPSMSSEELVSLVLETADDLGDAGTDEVYGRGMLNLDEASKPQGEIMAVGYNNQVLAGAVLLSESNISLSHHFGGVINNLSIGIRDNYNRTFNATPAQAMINPLAFGLDSTMDNFTRDEDDIVTQNFNAQTQMNFSTQSDDAWMNASYQYGESSAKIGYHATYYKDASEILNPDAENNQLGHLRFTDINPAGTDIAHIRTIHRLNDAISITPYAARGTFTNGDNDIGNKFSELGADINLATGNTYISIGMGNLREYQQFLGAQTTGAYALNNASLSRFTDMRIERVLTPIDAKMRLALYAEHTEYQTDVDMLHDGFVAIDNLTANQYQIGFIGSNIAQKNDRLTIKLATKLGVTNGVLTQDTVDGYNENGEFNNVTQQYQLATQHRNHQLSAIYQSPLPYLWQNNAQSNLINNSKFFTSITIDRNLYNQHQLNQTEIMVGVSSDF